MIHYFIYIDNNILAISNNIVNKLIYYVQKCNLYVINYQRFKNCMKYDYILQDVLSTKCF